MPIEKVTPLGDRVLVKRDDAEEKSPGGILIPDVAKKDSTLGKVVAVGPGGLRTGMMTRDPVAVKAGQRVLFSKYAGTEVDVNGEKMTMLREDDIFAIVE